MQVGGRSQVLLLQRKSLRSVYRGPPASVSDGGASSVSDGGASSVSDGGASSVSDGRSSSVCHGGMKAVFSLAVLAAGLFAGVFKSALNAHKMSPLP